MEFRILGPLEVEDGGRAIELGGARPRALLAILLLRRNEVVPAERLLEDLYGAEQPVTAAKSLQVHISRLRKSLGRTSLHTRGTGYLLEAGADDVDADRFVRQLAAGRAAVAAGDAATAERSLEDALALWRGPPLADVAYQDFAQAEIARLEELRLGCIEELCEARLALGRHTETIVELEQLVAEHPLRERLRAQLMLALYRSGRQAEALEAYRDTRTTLVDELGIEPSRKLRELEAKILAQDPMLEGRGRVAGLPAGTVTFLFTDVEGSTRLLHELGTEDYAEALAEHRRVLRTAFETHGGVEVDTHGDAFFVAFPTAPGALDAAATALDGLAGGPISVRVGVHTGTPLVTEDGYVGEDVHRAARIAACGHGGQVLVSASTAALLDAGLRDLGEHRLKDLSAAERIYQLGEAEFPALKSLYRTNLPTPATPFLGRERDLEEVLQLLQRADLRLLTLTGPGGTGKTRLALQAAAAASDAYPDGVFWVPLAPLRDPELVMQGAAQALEAEDGLAEHIADKRLLLLFDNFEHVVEAAGRLAGLLAACPNLCLVVTSREPLHLSGEQEYPVAPLAHDEGIEFFSSRARAIKPNFEADETVSEICRRLDDLPLALELAAARTKALSSRQILERLEQRLPLLTGGARDLPERQRTMRATIEWSHDLLTEDEQRLFARLAVFRGGCTLEAAEQVAETGLDTLHSLVDKSLLRHSDDRYWMLETVREYATEQLDASGEAGELRDRHTRYFLELAEHAAPTLRDIAFQGGGDVLDVLEREHDNLRAALDRLTAAGQTQTVLQIAGALAEFWYENDHWVELRGRLMDALAWDERPTAERARALIAASDTYQLGSDLAAAYSCADEALALYRTLDDRRGEADALFRLSTAVGEDFRSGLPHLEQAIELYREVDDQPSLIHATQVLAWAAWNLGDLERARALYEETLQRGRGLDNRFIQGWSLGSLAMIAAQQGRTTDAIALAREHIAIYLGFGKLRLGETLMQVAHVLAHAGRASVAAQLLASSEAVLEEIGAGDNYWARRENRKLEVSLHETLDPEAFQAAWEQGRALSLDEAVALALQALDANA